MPSTWNLGPRCASGQAGPGRGGADRQHRSPTPRSRSRSCARCTRSTPASPARCTSSTRIRTRSTRSRPCKASEQRRAPLRLGRARRVWNQGS
ncbi:MAG: nickel-dependent hydrogenase large subunit [Desulfobacterales bacterium]|nr:nickel-dependent hydrogenase large subunit [Desulfobacterales bacterium]